MISICTLAMAHGSNEINVSAPLTAEIFLLDPTDETIQQRQEYIAILIGLVSVLVGTLLLGRRLLYKQRKKFMKTTISNGTIVNTCTALLLFLASSLNQTVSCTYILVPSLVILQQVESNKQLNYYKAMKAVIFAVAITLFSAFFSVITSTILLWLDYNGPYSEMNNAYHR